MSIAKPAFSAYAELLQIYLDNRTSIIDALEKLLNCQNKPAEYQQDIVLQGRLFMECFQAGANLDRDQMALPVLLEKARWDDGLKPRDELGNDIVDAVQLLLRAYHFWQQTRWPGQKGRRRFAQTLFNIHVLRLLILLTLQLWDEVSQEVSLRVASLQTLLNNLWQGSPADQPVLVRKIHWLIPVALSPTTDDLRAYFEFAARIASTFPEADREETQRAWVQTGAGHLCAQLRHLSVQQSVPLNEHSLVLVTRKSNALDVCLIMEGLVTLFKAYERVCQNGDEQQRLSLAAAICHGVSPDPELFLVRLDLLAPYTMIEHLFIEKDEAGLMKYTPAGSRHLALLSEYKELLKRIADQLFDDSKRCRPVAGGCSPYGVLFGFSSNLLELMAFKTLQFEPVLPFSMEDIFTVGGADKKKWVNGWRNLPHIPTAVSKQFEYPEDFAQSLHTRVERSLQNRVSLQQGAKSYKPGKLFINNERADQTVATSTEVPELPVKYVVSSDKTLVDALVATFQNEGDLLHCRLEGEFLVSYQSAGGWTGIDKDLITEVIALGTDIKITYLPDQAKQVLKMMCPDLITE